MSARPKSKGQVKRRHGGGRCGRFIVTTEGAGFDALHLLFWFYIVFSTFNLSFTSIFYHVGEIVH